ncbi:hypothetical protein ACWC2K_28525 [Streptomyces chattanoogensis]
MPAVLHGSIPHVGAQTTGRRVTGDIAEDDDFPRQLTNFRTISPPT